MVETTSEDFTYCVLLPERIDEQGRIQVKTFGTGPKIDSIGAYDGIFKLKTNTYRILSMCIYEVCILLAYSD
jgi:hypothetical protein